MPPASTIMPRFSLCEARCHSALAALYLDGNQIQDTGATALVDALHVKGALKKLVVPDGIEKHAGLIAAYKAKGINLV